jgi:hypothetical protein
VEGGGGRWGKDNVKGQREGKVKDVLRDWKEPVMRLKRPGLRTMSRGSSHVCRNIALTFDGCAPVRAERGDRKVINGLDVNGCGLCQHNIEASPWIYCKNHEPLSR